MPTSLEERRETDLLIWYGSGEPQLLAPVEIPDSILQTEDIRKPTTGGTTANGLGDTLQIVGDWRLWLEASLAPSTVRTYWTAARLFLMSDSPLPIGEIRQEHITAFLVGFPYRSSARRTYYQALKSLFDFAESRGEIMVNPVSGIRVPAVVEKVPRALTEEEVERLVDAAGRRSRRRALALLILYHTGARLNEAVNLAWSDVNEGHLIIRVAKGGRERKVPISTMLTAVLAEQHDFTGNRERIIDRTGQTIWHWVHQAGKDAGLEGVHPHLLRSSFATRILVKGAKPHTVQNLLGHQNIRTTMRYWAVTDEDRKSAVELLGSANRLVEVGLANDPARVLHYTNGEPPRDSPQNARRPATAESGDPG